MMFRKEKNVYVLFSRESLIASLVVLFPIVWMILQAMQRQHPLDFLIRPGQNYARVFGDSYAEIFHHSVVVQFFVQNIATWNIFGLIALFVIVREEQVLRRWLSTPVIAFIILTLLSLSGRALPNHSFWRISVVWTFLLVPFSSVWLMMVVEKFFSFLSRRGKIVVLFCLVGVLWIQDYSRAEVLTHYADFSFPEREAGTYIGEVLSVFPAGAEPKVLIDTHAWQYLHVMVASGRPDAFMFNTGRDPSFPSTPFVDTKHPLDFSVFQKAHIGYLLFKKKELKEYLNASKGVRLVKEFEGWSLYEVQ